MGKEYRGSTNFPAEFHVLKLSDLDAEILNPSLVSILILTVLFGVPCPFFYFSPSSSLYWNGGPYQFSVVLLTILLNYYAFPWSFSQNHPFSSSAHIKPFIYLFIQTRVCGSKVGIQLLCVEICNLPLYYAL